jgi:hypothetical protein
MESGTGGTLIGWTFDNLDFFDVSQFAGHIFAQPNWGGRPNRLETTRASSIGPILHPLELDSIAIDRKPNSRAGLKGQEDGPNVATSHMLDPKAHVIAGSVSHNLNALGWDIRVT